MFVESMENLKTSKYHTFSKKENLSSLVLSIVYSKCGKENEKYLNKKKIVTQHKGLNGSHEWNRVKRTEKPKE